MTNEVTKTEPLIRLAVRLCRERLCCAICSRMYSDDMGLLATFIAEEGDFADLQRYVCEGCAANIDADLADYAYNPNHIPEKRTLANSDNNYFGDCPECGKAGDLVNVESITDGMWENWLICFKHGLKWRVGINLFSVSDSEAQEIRNDEILLRCRHIHIPRGLDPTHYATGHLPPYLGATATK